MIRQASVALIRQDDTILLVQQLGPHDSKPYWTLPGGTVENGETLPETLIREVREETGLHVTEIGGLIYLVQSVTDTTQSIAFIFEVKHWTGIPSAERDTYVFETAFFPLQEALALLDDGPYLNMREPITAYLRGKVAMGTAWFYRNQHSGRTLVDCLTIDPATKGK